MRSLQRPGRSPVLAPHGMASTSSPLATQAAVTVLQNGGNAMDAALAAAAVQAVVEPQSTSIGRFCLWYFKDKFIMHLQQHISIQTSCLYRRR